MMKIYKNMMLIGNTHTYMYIHEIESTIRETKKGKNIILSYI